MALHFKLQLVLDTDGDEQVSMDELGLDAHGAPLRYH